MLFGVYDDRVPVYEQVPTTIEYYQKLSEDFVTFESGLKVDPIDVLPGKWLYFTDLFIGEPEADTLSEDIRAMFIESVKYTYPQGLVLSGGKTDSLTQKLAKLGLAGIGGA